MTKFFNKLKKLFFWPIFSPLSQFLEQKFFFQKIWLSCKTPNGCLALCKNIGKTNDTIPRKCQYRQIDGLKDGWKYGRTDRPYFIGPFRLSPEVQYPIKVPKNTFKTHVHLILIRKEGKRHYVLIKHFNTYDHTLHCRIKHFVVSV